MKKAVKRQTINEAKLYTIVENLVRKYLKEEGDIAGIPSGMGDSEPVDDRTAELEKVKERVYKAFRRGGPERQEKAEKYRPMINACVDRMAAKYPERTPEQIEFHIFNDPEKYPKWTGASTKTQKGRDEVNAIRREKYNDESNAASREKANAKKRAARAAAKEVDLNETSLNPHTMDKALFVFYPTGMKIRAIKAYTREECEALAEAGEIDKFTFKTVSQLENLLHDKVIAAMEYRIYVRIFL